MTDPLDKIADPNADIFSTLYPARRKVSTMAEAVKQVIEELPESQKTLFFKRYVLEMTFDEIADEEFLVTGVRITKQAVSQRHQRMLAQVKKKARTESTDSVLRQRNRGFTVFPISRRNL